MTSSIENQPYAQHLLKARAMEHLDARPFRPAWWLPGRHLQTIWGPLSAHRHALPFICERWETPDDDFLDVYFYEGRPELPRVLLLHGLEGSVRSFYVSRLAAAFHALGWNVSVMEFRSCGSELNRSQRIYHMGETSDLDFVVGRLLDRVPEQALFLVGVSLGGNVVAKWLGERGGEATDRIVAAAAISPPFQPDVGAPHFHKILGGIYARRFLKSLIPKAIAKEAQFPGLYDVEAVRGCRDFQTFDTLVTARLHGFRDADHYWKTVGCGQFLPHIRVPTLLLTSADDPFNPESTLPEEAAAASAYLHPQFTRKGGHVGFIAGQSWRVEYWMEQQVARFFTFYAAAAT